MKKIYVMSKGQIQEKSVDGFCVINYFDFTNQSLLEVQETAIAKNHTLEVASREGRLLSVEVNDVEVTKETKKIAKKSLKKKVDIPLRLMDDQEAKRIIDFVIKNKNSDFIFQCDFGRSRSLTTAYFASRFILNEHRLINKEILVRNRSIFKFLLRNLLFPNKYS